MTTGGDESPPLPENSFLAICGDNEASGKISSLLDDSCNEHCKFEEKVKLWTKDMQFKALPSSFGSGKGSGGGVRLTETQAGKQDQINHKHTQSYITKIEQNWCL